ncbi:conjugal transfer protein TrbG [Gluconacetobacter johannae DSM 13595]|nr:conjugal transfer protein TrbG [Gluconacetobacter johannae DSM 13595]
MIRMIVRALPLTLLALSACSGQYHPPVIRYDDAVQATRLPDPPKPVRVVEVPQPLPLPGQLKPLPPRRTAHPAPEVADPTARVTQANLAARIQPTRAGFINAVQVYPYSSGALYQVYTSPGEITDIMLQQGEKLVGTGPVAAGDTVRWIIGDTESGGRGDKTHPYSGQTDAAGPDHKPDRQHRPADLSRRTALHARDLHGIGVVGLSRGRPDCPASTGQCGR